MIKHLTNILGAIIDTVIVGLLTHSILEGHMLYLQDLIFGVSDNNLPEHIYYARLILFTPIILFAILAFFIDIYDEYRLIVRRSKSKALKRKHDLYKATFKNNDDFIEHEAGKLYDEDHDYIADILPD